MLPLQGVKVVEIGQNLAGPYASEILAMLGAEVVKVERPEGDDARAAGARPSTPASPPLLPCGQPQQAQRGAGPEGTKAALAWLRELPEETPDIVVQNMRPGSLEAMGPRRRGGAGADVRG